MVDTGNIEREGMRDDLLSTVGEVQTHETVVGLHEGTIDIEISGGTGQGLDVDTLLVGIQVEGLEGTLLAKTLRHVNLLVTTIVSILTK